MYYHENRIAEDFEESINALDEIREERDTLLLRLDSERAFYSEQLAERNEQLSILRKEISILECLLEVRAAGNECMYA
ncbi:MAG: hypothetical protein KAR42_17340 [candidate division Zixibacteria bacterium]|nr:hypothetical protein [candidate division Zixibacteria bacterium]